MLQELAGKLQKDGRNVANKGRDRLLGRAWGYRSIALTWGIERVILLPVRMGGAFMKVTTKGQVTIPMEIREQLDIHPGADVEFVVEGNAVKMIPVTRTNLHGRRIVERLRGKGSVSMTTDEIMALTRGEA